MEKIDYKKSLGQNFIYDTNLLRAIATDGEVSSHDTVLEIGAGAGTLTTVLAKMSKKVISFEIDKELQERLKKIADEYRNIEFHFMDFMNCDLKKILDDKNVKVVANIPYYITTPIIFKLIEEINNLDSILVLVQKEVAERFASKEGSKTYGITSVILQSIFNVNIPRVVRKECFTPSPKVDSALCKFVAHNKYKISDFEKFKEFVHKAFAMRRKTFVNNMIKAYSIKKDKVIQLLNKYNYLETSRPEDISVANFINIFNDCYDINLFMY